jgi:hypothetical protein
VFVCEVQRSGARTAEHEVEAGEGWLKLTMSEGVGWYCRGEGDVEFGFHRPSSSTKCRVKRVGSAGGARGRRG